MQVRRRAEGEIAESLVYIFLEVRLDSRFPTIVAIAPTFGQDRLQCHSRAERLVLGKIAREVRNEALGFDVA